MKMEEWERLSREEQGDILHKGYCPFCESVLAMFIEEEVTTHCLGCGYAFMKGGENGY